MNKLVIVGNGFDLAHELPTSYYDFVNDFWQNLRQNFKNKETRKLVSINQNHLKFLDFSPIQNYNDFRDNLMDYSNGYGYQYEKENHSCLKSPNEFIFKFENAFFRGINAKNSIQNWVDIENEYYQILKKSLGNIFNLLKRISLKTISLILG